MKEFKNMLKVEPFGIIYCITNMTNDKKYVGVTTRNVESRFEEHCKADSCIGRAIRKYGVDNFSVSFIDDAEDDIELSSKEIDYIKLYKSNDQELGYNQTIGGDGIGHSIKINLNEDQFSFVNRVNAMNKQKVNVENKALLEKSITYNLAMFYLTTNKIFLKKRVANLLLKLKPSYQRLVFDRHNLLDIDEVEYYSNITRYGGVS